MLHGIDGTQNIYPGFQSVRGGPHFSLLHPSKTFIVIPLPTPAISTLLLGYTGHDDRAEATGVDMRIHVASLRTISSSSSTSLCPHQASSQNPDPRPSCHRQGVLGLQSRRRNSAFLRSSSAVISGKRESPRRKQALSRQCLSRGIRVFRPVDSIEEALPLIRHKSSQGRSAWPRRDGAPFSDFTARMAQPASTS